VAIPVGKLPLTVTFIDPNKPETIREVDPSVAEEVLGDGYRIAAAEIRMTTAPLTKLIATHFPWTSIGLSTKKCSSMSNNQLRTLHCDDPLIMRNGKL
jgi:hypothetical protein